jgi:hypothetical protein
MERLAVKTVDLEEYVGCMIERTENFLKFTQPALIQSYSDKFELPKKYTRHLRRQGQCLWQARKLKH